MRNEHDDDPTPSLKQRGDIEIEGFSDLDEGVHSEEREDADEGLDDDDDAVGER